MQNDELLSKISELKERFALSDESHKEVIASWEAEAKTKMIQAGLGENEAVQFIIGKISDDIDKINVVLQNSDSKQLIDIERDTLIKIKKFYEWFKNFFIVAKSDLSRIEAEVTNNLTDEE